jgi:transcription-repair coupling factor (superfamily II helicase)
MRDLDIRGAGNLLGAEQSGFINDLGYETYHKILDEAVQELKENEFRELFTKDLSSVVDLRLPDCQIETDLQIIIPETYVSNISERLSLYNQLDNIEKEEELQEFQKSMLDRFGPMPEEVENLFKIARIRWKAEQIGFEKLTLKNNILKGYFVSQERTEYFQTDKFGKILDYIKNNPKRCLLKEIKSKLLLTVEKVQSIDVLDKLLSGLI